ncbi:MAG: ROK family protein [Acidimicrobiales bacterium]|nr:ROK family protein [Acidimicrobiales bacterium]MCB9373490.1 ROK family protein [Microthrixaceae bacterium]
MERLGIDIGGSGIKAAPVDVATGALLAERHRIETPQPATPDAVAATVAELVAHFGWTGPLGATFPAIVRAGVIRSAANVDPSWIGADAARRFADATGCPVTVLNDADAAGVAEMTLGAGRGVAGVVLLLTFGTGIGSALFVDGHLVPNTELGHLEVDGHDAEHRAAASVREDHDLSWKHWAKRVDRYLEVVEALFSPELLIVGGGVSKKADKFLPLLHRETPVVPAQLRNQAGIVGAAMASVAAHPPG